MSLWWYTAEDDKPSVSTRATQWKGKVFYEILAVRGLGAVVVTGTADLDDPKGKIRPDRCFMQETHQEGTDPPWAAW